MKAEKVVKALINKGISYLIVIWQKVFLYMNRITEFILLLVFQYHKTKLQKKNKSPKALNISSQEYLTLHIK